MQVESQPNKYKIFQDYYLTVNGELISYSEALRLYSQLDDDTKLDFEKFYKDETGYEIIVASGYNLDARHLENTKILNKANINTKYTIEAYAKKSGKILDPKWSGYSAEEIMQMVNNGVNIPQDIVDLANTILQTSGANVEGTDDNTDEGDNTTEKEPYLDLIPKAKKKIEKCNDTTEKINDKVEDLLPEKQKHERNFLNKAKDQKKALKEYEEQLREWRSLQNKVNNGEALSDTEAKKYAQLTGMLEDKNTKNSDNMQFDKNAIARSLNDINILAVLGEKLADETIEIGDTLADYTSQANYKMTAQTVSHEIGFIGTIMAMAQGKNLAKEANKIGNDTKEYSSDTTKSVGDIADILGVQNSVLSANELQGSDDVENTTPSSATEDAKTPASNEPEGTVDNENEDNNAAKEETKTPETTAEEDFIVNDKNVQELIKEGSHIHSDMTGQTVRALRNSIDAKSDKKFAKYANYKITRIIKQYKDEEEKREEEIAKLEQENKEAKEKLEKLTGKSGDELDKEINNTSDKKDQNNNLSESDKKEVENLKTGIQSNNQRITELKETAQTSIDDFKNKTVKEKSRISTAVPKENQEFEANTEYKEKIIPQAKEDLSFTDNSGETLTKMGKYRVIVGLQQIAMMQFKKGYKNVAKGAVSVGIGFGAQIVGSLPTPKLAEKATTNAIKNETSAIEGLNQADAMISSITGEETTQSTYEANKQDNQDQTAGNAEEGATNTADGTNEETQSAGVQTTSAKVATAEQQTNSATTQTEPAQSTETGSTTGAAAPVQEEKPSETSVETISSNELGKQTSKATKTVSDGEKETPEEKETNEVENKAAEATTSSSSSTSSSKKEEMTTDKADDSVGKAEKSAKSDAKDSENVKKDTEKTTKQLEKETKQLTKQMKKDEKEIIKMTKESQRAAKKQEEMVAEYEAIVAENEQLTAEDMNAQRQAQIQGQNQVQTQSSNAAAQTDTQSVQQQAATLSSTAAQGNATQTPNADKIASNDARLNEIGVSFEASGKVITRNRKKITRLQKSTKATQKKFTKKTKLIDKKNKEAEKKEVDKQKRLAKQLGVVGVAENVFSITLSTGMILAAIPWSHAVGEVMITIGTKGVLYCGLVKGLINIANGNVAAGLMAIGQAVLTVAMSQAGAGGATSNVLTQVSAGLSVVSSSADLVNNVRAIEGKEASGIFGKISAIAGAASAVTGIAGSMMNGTKIVDGSKQAVKSSFSQASSFGKVTQLAGAAGSVLSSTSQVMTQFGAEGKTAQLLGAIGGAISTVAAVGSLLDSKMNKAVEKNEENKDNSKTESTEGTDNSNNSDSTDNNTNNTDKTEADKKTESEKSKEEQKKEIEEKKAQAEIKNAEQNIKVEDTKAQTDDKSKTTIEQVKKEETPKEKLENAKKARDAQKAEANKEENNLGKDAKKNMVENGASKEYADINDDVLAKKLEFAQEMGDNDTAKALSAELEKRGQYKDQMAVIAENKAKKAKVMSKVTDTIGSGIKAATSIMNMGNNNKDQQKKKGYVAGNLTKRSKEIIKKNRKRIAALAKKGY